MSSSTLSGVFIGGQSLLIRCGESFLRRGHDLRAVVTADPAVRRWAEEHGIACLAPDRELTARLAQESFDYLFSVVHLAILPAALLALPRRGAINFHDGPLPEYAGLNVTSWALLNREREHGVTWHVMTERPDAGDILGQARFPIDADDTALTLNAKCYEAGVASFEELLVRMENEALEPRPQDLQRRRYFAKDQRPAAAGAIDWSAPAEEIAALVRALEFGPYPNPLTTAKTWVGDTPIAVRRVEVLASRSHHPPGTVTEVTADAVTVSTGTHGLRLSSLTTLLGARLEPADLQRTHHLEAGHSLSWPAGDRARALGELDAGLRRHEGFWLGRLASIEPVEIPFARRGPGSRSGPPAAQRFDTPLAFLERFEGAAADALLAALCAYLSRIAGKSEFTVAFRHAGLERVVSQGQGLFSARLPLQVRVEGSAEFDAYLKGFREELQQVQKHASYPLDVALRHPADAARARAWHEEAPPLLLQRVPSLEGTASASPVADLTVIVPDDARATAWSHRPEVLDAQAVSRMYAQFRAFLDDLVERRTCLRDVNVLSDEDEERLLSSWTRTDAPFDRERCVHQLFEAQVERTPDAVALAFRDQELTYRDLDARANQVAHHLIGRGVGPGSLVGVLMDRSADLVVAMMGILKAGAAYVPLDPTYPAERVRYMATDAALVAILTEDRYLSFLPDSPAPMVAVDSDLVRQQPLTSPPSSVNSDDLAYVIYTSGSTGTPKGVMVEHRNVANFFAGMDACLGRDAPGTWLAVTSISFDISVLELFWTLARGFKVVIYGGEGEREAPAASSRPVAVGSQGSVPFSLFYFASDEGGQGEKKYELLLEGAKFADQNGFEAVWTPERHFHAFGGLYPSPSVASAAIAVLTRRVQIRAGSCVLPLHSPLRVAEEWAMVDNLSNGRVGISFASGWQPDDFVLAPERYAERHEAFYRGIETVRALWRGEGRAFRGPEGEVETRTLPRPVQPELPFWVTAAGNPETFRRAGELGANLLTHLLGQSVDELAGKLEVYRQAWREAGHPGRGQATLMLHTFVGESEAFVRAQVHGPLKSYLRSATNLLKQHASSFPAFRQAGREGLDGMFQKLSAQDLEALLEHAFARYYETSGLFGTPESCLAMVDRLKRIGVDEIACLIDFGVPSDVVLASLPKLNELRQLAQGAPGAHTAVEDHGLAGLLARHGVTHLQCTPSMARILSRNEPARAGLRKLDAWLVGGEALASDLAAELRGLVSGHVLNMYGPTETTVWSASHQVVDAAGAIPIGRPIANTRIYVVDQNLRPVPVGIPGELVIGGAGVVRGYLNRPELTAQRFVADPFGPPGGRLYRTGDRARWRDDGVLEFLGRMDDQVKIRGHRVELGEIEAALARHPAVQQAAVAAREDGPGDRRLVGYVVARRAGRPPTPSELRDHLKRDLPEFMVPATFVLLETLPLTPNKKVDRKSLPAPDASRPALDRPYVPARTKVEVALAGFFQEVLGLERVGVHDSFVELGGNSLSAVELFLKIEEAFKVEFPLATFFRSPTVAGLAAELERVLGASPDAERGRQS
ncbi:MAG: LLM class flavin-dependent oxidoreductase [Myxococcales bacterium]